MGCSGGNTFTIYFPGSEISFCSFSDYLTNTKTESKRRSDTSDGHLCAALGPRCLTCAHHLQVGPHVQHLRRSSVRRQCFHSCPGLRALAAPHTANTRTHTLFLTYSLSFLPEFPSVQSRERNYRNEGK